LGTGPRDGKKRKSSKGHFWGSIPEDGAPSDTSAIV
jgi:hypothetical protein